MDDLDDIEQLRIAALQTLHQKKVETRPPVTYTASRPSFEDEHISSFPGYNNSHIQLSPRSAAFVESNISILKRRKEGLDTDRWSRSPSPKYKAIKRKSLSPLPLPRRSPHRKHKRSSRSPVAQPHHGRSRVEHDNHHRSSTGRSRPRSRDRNNGERRIVGRRLEQNPRPRTRSKSPAATRRTNRNHTGEERSSKRSKDGGSPSDTRSAEAGFKSAAPEAEELKEEEMDEEKQKECDSSDSDSSASSAIDLFASEESESENEGRFKCSTRTTNQGKVSFSSALTNKADLKGTVLPDGPGEGSERRNGRSEGYNRNRQRGPFKSSFRKVERDSSEKRGGERRRREANGFREERAGKFEAADAVGMSRHVRNSRKAATSEKNVLAC